MKTALTQGAGIPMQSNYEIASRVELKTFPTVWIKRIVSVTPTS